jgi:class 3 adenylate cyclase
MTEIGTFMFADLAGYTALTEAHGDERAADLAQMFCERVCSLELDHGGRDVKTLGDAVMSWVPDPREAIALGVRIVDVIGRSHGFPAVRVGMHYGSAVRRGDDWFGATVNLAARVADLATAGQVLLTDATRRRAGSLTEIEVRDNGDHRFKNVAQAVRIWSARSGRHGPPLPVDPVCRMVIDPARAAAQTTREGERYWFCSEHCLEAFDS